MTNKDTSESFVPFYGESAGIHMSLKVSKDGLSREEDTTVLQGLYEEDHNVRNIGYRIKRRLFGPKENAENGESDG